VDLLGVRPIRFTAASARSGGLANAYVYAVLGGLAGTLVAALLVDWVLPFVYNIGMNGFRGSMLAWIFMGGLVSLEQILN